MAAFSQARNPLWQNFLGLFAEVDRGGKNVGVERGYNGNLFKPDPEIDSLQLEDEPWIRGFKNFGNYDFSEEVNVEVLGHLFERSITELEKLRVGGLFALQGAEDESASRNADTPPVAEARRSVSKMPKSAGANASGSTIPPRRLRG